MYYNESKTRMNEIVAELKANKKRQKQLVDSIHKISNELAGYTLPVVKMTNSEYYILANKFIENETCSLLQQFSTVVNKGPLFFEHAKDLMDKYSRPISQAKNLITGIKAEDTVFNELKGLIPQNLILLKNILLNGSEHDILILSKSGIYTIEVKAHSGVMEWDGLGRYTEFSLNKKGQKHIINGAVDPCSQAMKHRISLMNLLKSIKNLSIPTASIPINSLVTITNHVTVKTSVNRPQPVYGIVHTAHVIESRLCESPLLSDTDLKSLHKLLLENKQPERVYEFYDLQKIELDLSEQLKHFFEKFKEVTELNAKDAALRNELKTLEEKVRCHANWLDSKGFNETLRTVLGENPILHNILFAIGIVMVLGSLKMKIILSPIVFSWAIIVYVITILRFFKNRRNADKFFDLSNTINHNLYISSR